MGRGRGASQSEVSPSRASTIRKKKTLSLINDPVSTKIENPDYMQDILKEYRTLSPEAMDSLHKELRPRGSSGNGFLAKDENLLEVVEQDVADLAELGLTPQDIGIQLFNASQAIFPSMGVPRVREAVLEKNGFPKHIDVRGGSALRGWQVCPFASQGLCHCDKKDNDQIISMHPSSRIETLIGNLNFQIYNEKTKESIKVSGLISHLAADHNFFEGSVQHRVDPVKLARVLELA